MKIYFRNIPPEGLAINSAFSHVLVDQREEDDLRFIEPFHLKGNVYKAQDELIVNIRAKGKYHSFCSRCLCEVDQPYETQCDLFYDIPAKGANFIDIADDIRQEILLNLPPIILCRPDCKGICPGCGVNLNENKCQCK
jgi:uncharacterized protein